LALQQTNPGLFGLLSVFKERFSALWADLNPFGCYFNGDQLFATKMTVSLFRRASNLGFEKNIFGREVRKRFDRIYPRIKSNLNEGLLPLLCLAR